MFKNKGLCLQECITYVLKLCFKCIIRVICKLGDLVSQQFGIDCTYALGWLSQLNVLHRLHADMLIWCLTVLLWHACRFCLLWTGLCTHFTSGAFLLNSFILQLTSIKSLFRKQFYSIKWWHHPVLKPKCLYTNKVLASCQPEWCHSL